MDDKAAGTVASHPVDMTARLQMLARTTPALAPIISVYLDTRWSDEHQRERVRIFLKNEIRKAEAMSVGGVCRWCGAATGVVELGEGMIQRVLAASGDVASVDTHTGLARAGGVAALLRYSPR